MEDQGTACQAFTALELTVHTTDVSCLLLSHASPSPLRSDIPTSPYIIGHLLCLLSLFALPTFRSFSAEQAVFQY